MQIYKKLFSAVLALAAISSNQASACASCGCTLSTDWGSQGVSTAQGFSADLSYAYINQNKPIYGSNTKSSAALINTLYANGQEIETATKTQTVTAAFNYNSDTWGISLQIPYLNRSHATNGNLDPASEHQKQYHRAQMAEHLPKTAWATSVSPVVTAGFLPTTPAV